ncbi:MAG: hypothetical protein JRI97_13225 [Deltaproteobacteria bacterium]|nr:hypothetical protein [Deltaproteobacteria bacterium]
MKKTLCLMVSATACLLFLCSPALAGKPSNVIDNSNGFPSGPHFTLNIHGKTDFSCENNDTGHSIFVPEDGAGTQIHVVSGWSLDHQTVLVEDITVLDKCAVFDGTPAVIALPPTKNGYRVYARVLAKPTDMPGVTITPEIVLVEDEAGTDLYYLGEFDLTSKNLVRDRGKSKAEDITGLFLWTGDVCYDEFMTLDCEHYESEWVFNIGDFVEYMWNYDNSGLKLLQVRFYPN